MTVPYGAVHYGESVAGGSLVAAEKLGPIEVEALASYAHRVTSFLDVSTDVYDWNGRIIHQRPLGGEIDGTPHDVTLIRDTIYTRFSALWQIVAGHSLRIVSSISFDSSSGVSKAGLQPGEPDPLAAIRSLRKAVTGVEYHANLFRDRVDNLLFLKHYDLHASATELLSGATFAPLSLDDDTAGAGDAVRVRLYRHYLYGKASYEYATRLPNANEIFGDGILVNANGRLVPERSQNANVGLGFEVRNTRVGSFDGELNGFLRAADNLILLLATANSFTYQNVYGSRALGVESLVHWRSPRDWVTLETSFTYQDLRNVSTSGPYAAYNGERLPNQPWLFFNTALRLQYRFLANVVSLTWFTRYVQSFYRDWESLGAPQYKQTVDSQFSQSLSLGYWFRTPHAAGSLTFDIENLTDEKLFDVYGVQRPGRAFYGKTTLQF
jgi:hypothetical protein